MKTNSEPVQFFKSELQFRQWLKKNHKSKSNQWVGFYKKASRQGGLTFSQAVDQALCFGWIYSIIKGLDPFTYKVQFLRRKPKSAWSLKTLRRAEALQKQGLLQAAGKAALQNRDRKKSVERPPKFSTAQLKTFRANEMAWAFFTKQTPSYQKYMTLWVTQAQRPETRQKRLEMLIHDSANGSKLARVVQAQEKVKKRFPPGQTPIEEARNIGPVCGAELRSIGIDTVEKLKTIGWEKAFYRLCELHPHRINVNMATGLAAAVEDQDWRKMDPDLKAEAREVVQALRNGWSR